MSLIVTAVTGGIFIGTMRANISMNTEQIIQSRVEFFRRLDRVREEQINQDEQLDRVQTSLIELNATVAANLTIARLGCGSVVALGAVARPGDPELTDQVVAWCAALLRAAGPASAAPQSAPLPIPRPDS